MNTRIRRPVALLVATACGLAAGAAHAAIGARVLVQQWSPLNPDQQSVQVLADQPSVVSDSLARAWSTVRTGLCNAIKAQLGASRAAAGQTLRDIECNLDPNMTLELRQNGPNGILATFTLPSNSITATSTQPTVCGSECDPRFSVSARAQVVLGITVQQDPNRPLVVTAANLAFSNASIDSHNFAADVIKWVDDNLVPFFNGSSFQTMATNAINNVQFNFAGQINNALAPVNAQLRGPAQYVRVGLWARATRITVAFAPPPIAPSTNGSMSGVVRWDPTKAVGADQGVAPNCANIRIVSTVQTGPAPLLDPDNYSNLGPAPMRELGTFSANTAGAACMYLLNGIAASWPNKVTATVAGGSQGSVVKTSYVLSPDGWSGAVVPNPAAPNHNYLMAQRIGGVATEVNIARRLRNPGDPVINPAREAVSNPATIRTRSPVAVTTVTQPPAAAAVKTPSVVATQPAGVVAGPVVASPVVASPVVASPVVANPVVATPAAAAQRPAITPSTLSRGATQVSGAARTTTVSPPQSTLGR
jgi:hypothetical protein